jgi:ankyrin repeat protein
MKADWRAAAIAGDSKTIAQLIAGGENIDSRDKYGQTALMLAALYGRDEVVGLVLAKGAQLNVTAKYRLSALMLAVINYHTGIAKQLVDAGADLKIRGSDAGFYGKTARDLANDRDLRDLVEYIAQAEGLDRKGD